MERLKLITAVFCDAEPSNDCEADCEGIWGGPAVRDECDICNGNGACDCGDESINCECCCPLGQERDCLGECNGSAVLDQCNVCAGNNACLDCADSPYGSAVTDNCGTCDTNPENDCTQDCNGDWGGSALLDKLWCMWW